MTYKKSLRSEEPEGFLRSERLLGGDAGVEHAHYSVNRGQRRIWPLVCVQRHRQQHVLRRPRFGHVIGADCWRTAVRQCADPMVLSVVHADHARRMAAVCGYGELRSWADSVIGRKARKPAGHAGQVHFSNGARIFNICCL